MRVSKPTKIIDFHQHVFWHKRDDAGLVANLDEHDIAQAVLLNWDLSFIEGDTGSDTGFNPAAGSPNHFHPGIPLSDLVLAKRTYPDRFILGYAPHPVSPNFLGRLEAAIEMYDVRVCGECKFRLGLDDPRMLEMFTLAGKKGLPAVIHLDIPYVPDGQGGRKYDPQWYGGTVDNLERALQACPQTIICGHGPGFWREISGDASIAPGGYPSGPVVPGGKVITLLDRYPNLYCDLSAGSGCNALKRDTAFGRDFLLRYHQRILFARDYYDGNLNAFLQSQNLPQDVSENIYHRNAERLLRIKS